MAVCPSGHDSADEDFCDICGMRVGGNPAPGASATGSSPAARAPRRPRRPSAPAAEPCPRCGTPRTGQFCEACGFNFAGPRFVPAAPAPSASASAVPPTARHPPDRRGTSRPFRPPARGPIRPFRPSAHAVESPPSLVPVPAGHLDRGGGRGPGLLRAGAGGYRAGRRGRRVPLLLCRTAFPARRQPDADRTAQRVTRPGAGDRPDRAARRSGHQPAARGADRHAGRQLGRARSRFGQRHAGQRLRDRGGGPGPPARRRSHQPRRLDRDHRAVQQRAIPGTNVCT